MAPAYKLTYFNGRGAGEPLRFLLHYGAIAFEDNRIEQENWPKIKDTTPFGQIPILEYNGKVANQSVSLCRYIAKQVGLVGKDDWENLEIDSVVDTIVDILHKVGPVVGESDEEKKKILTKQLREETLPYYFSRFEDLTKKNNAYLTSLGRLTWADVYFAAVTEVAPEVVGDNILDPYPGLKALKEKVYAVPNIKKWVEERPQTAF